MTRGSTSANKEPFNLDKLRELVELMDKYDLTDVSLTRADQKWRLRRGSREAPAAAAAPAPVVAATAAVAPAVPEPQVDDGLVEIVSPTVGTFYSAASPDDPAFVKVGSKVEQSTVVCIVEAMKVFNQIPAEVSGTIVEVLVSNGDSVEFGQPMFRVRPG